MILIYRRKECILYSAKMLNSKKENLMMKKFLAIVLALTFVFAFVACGEKKDPEFKDVKSEGVMTYDEFAAAALESKVTIEGYVQAKQVYSEQYGNTSLYLQDTKGAYFVYRLACTAEEYAKFTEGVKVKIVGYKAEWSGEIEIIDVESFSVDASVKYTAPVFDATSLLGTDDLIKHQNEKVSFKGLTVKASTDADGNEAAYLYKWNGTGAEGDDLYFNVALGDKEFQFVVESDLCGADTEVYKAVKNLKIGDTIDLEGFLYWYNAANPHITSVKVVK